eukprot:2054983-Rhodomonas_salina.1
MCTADNPGLLPKPIESLARQEPASARRALLNSNNWLHSETESVTSDGRLSSTGQGDAVPTTSLRRGKESQHKIAAPRVRLYAHHDLSDVEDDPGTIPDATDTFDHSYLLPKHEPNGHTFGTENLWDKLSKASSRGPSQDRELRNADSASDWPDDTRESFSDGSMAIRGPFSPEDQKAMAIKAIVWKQWIAMLSRSEGELGDSKYDRRISSSVESEASLHADQQMTTNEDSPVTSSQKLPGDLVLAILEKFAADRFICGKVDEADRGELQHWCHEVYFGWTKRAGLSGVLIAQCVASFADQGGCSGSMEPWLQAIYICAILFYAGDIVLLRFAVGRSEFLKLNARKLGILFHFVLVVIDASLRLADLRTNHFSRPIWPLLLVCQLPDVGAACRILIQLIRRLGPLLIAWFGLITLLLLVGTMAVRFACPFYSTACPLEVEFEDAGASYRSFPIAIFSLWSLAFGDGYSRNMDALSSLVSPAFAFPFTVSALATSSLFLNCIAFALVWHHFRSLCTERHQQKQRVERTAMLKVFGSLCERSTPANNNSISPADVLQTLDRAFNLHSAVAWTHTKSSRKVQLLDLDWLLHPTIHMSFPGPPPPKDTSRNPPRLRVVEEGWPARLLYYVALGVNFVAVLYGSFLQDANPTLGLSCDPLAERAWDCQGQVALMAVDWAVFGVVLSALLLSMLANHPTAWLSLSFIGSFVAIAVEMGLLAHRHVLMRAGGAVGGVSLLVRLMRLPRLLPLVGHHPLASVLSRLLARIFPSLIQLSLLLFILLFPLASVIASALPCGARDTPGLLAPLQTPLLASFHLLFSIVATNDWPVPLLEFLRYLSPGGAGAVSVLLLLWWVSCRVVLAMMGCVTLEVALQSFAAWTGRAEADAWLPASCVLSAGGSDGQTTPWSTRRNGGANKEDDDEDELTACVTPTGLLLRGKTNLSDGDLADDLNGDDALIPLRWVQKCTVSRSSGKAWRVSLWFWGGRSVEMEVPSREEVRALELRIKTLVVAQRTCYSLNVQAAVHAAHSSWVRHNWTVKLSSFIDEMSTASTLLWDESLAPYSASGEGGNTAGRGGGAGEQHGDGDKEVSSLISTASTCKGAESRGMQEFSRRRVVKDAADGARGAAGTLHAQPPASQHAQATAVPPHLTAQFVGGDLDDEESRSARDGRRDGRGVKFSKRERAGALASDQQARDIQSRLLQEQRLRQGHASEDLIDSIPHEGGRLDLRGEVAWPSDASDPLLETRDVFEEHARPLDEPWLLGHHASPPDLDMRQARPPAVPERYARTWRGTAARATSEGAAIRGRDAGKGSNGNECGAPSAQAA